MDILSRLKIKNFVLEKNFFQDIRSENRFASRLKIRFCEKLFLHVFKYQKNFEKNHSDKIYRHFST